MKPAPFRYFAPRTVDEAISLLHEHGDEAKVLAGGQSLVPLMNFRFATPSVLIDVNRVDGLGDVRTGEVLQIGATVRQLQAENSPAIAQAVPVIRQALRYVGHAATRSRGTIGGSLAHADPAAELPAVLVALDGDVSVRSTRGERLVPARALFAGLFTTSLEPDELITAIRFPALPGHSAVYEVARRRGDFAIAGAIALLTPSSEGTISQARIALFGVGPTPARACAAEEFLIGRRCEDMTAISEAARIATEPLQPFDDSQIPGSYRKLAAQTAVKRALAAVATRVCHD